MINKKILFLLLLALGFSQSVDAQVYRVSALMGAKERLRVVVDRPAGSGETQLVLRRVKYGAVPQVDNLRCDRIGLKQVEAGVWVVPKGCEKISWEVPLADENVTLASAQQSVL